MRYLPLSDHDRQQMLAKVGVEHIDELFADVPEGKLLQELPDLPTMASEMEVDALLSKMAANNLSAGQAKGFFIGAGAYRHHVPATVDHLIQRSEFLTAYTPYQPEISQGTLQVLFEFQTQVAMLTGMEVANASMYDGSTATFEAVSMARRVTRRKKAILSGNLHPHYRQVVQSMEYGNYLKVMQSNLGDVSGDDLVSMPPVAAKSEDLISQIDDETACVVVQYPDFYGNLNDYAKLAQAAHVHKALLIVVVTEVVSLGAIKSPGEMGADIVVAEGQSIGCGLNFGGPYVGLFATRKKYIRQMPGRVCGQTVDAQGRRGFVLTLSTREQHIRREKATSNICTNSGLMALAFSIHLALLGEAGLRKLATINHQRACKLAEALEGIKGVKVLNKSFFNEFAIKIEARIEDMPWKDSFRNDGEVLGEDVVSQLMERGIFGGVAASDIDSGAWDMRKIVIVAATELTSDEEIADFVKALKEILV